MSIHPAPMWRVTEQVACRHCHSHPSLSPAVVLPRLCLASGAALGQMRPLFCCLCCGAGCMCGGGGQCH